MNRQLIQESVRYSQRWLKLGIAVLIAGMVVGLWRGDAAFALCFNCDVGPQPIEPSSFTPPANGVFNWTMRSRFGQQILVAGHPMINFHWTADTYTPSGSGELTTSNGSYNDDSSDPYVHPDRLEVDFDGCPNQSEKSLADNGKPTQNAYIWTIYTPTNDQELPNGSSVAPFVSPTQNTCYYSYFFC
jgi:hypothetical protein